MSERKFTVTVIREFDGSFVATVDELPGCIASGTTIENAMDMLVQVLPIYMEDFEGVDARVTRVEQIDTDEDRDIAHRELVLR